MSLPAETLIDLVAGSNVSTDDYMLGEYTVTINEVVLRASGVLKTSHESPVDAARDAWTFVARLTDVAGVEAAYMRKIGAIASPDVPGDAVVWRGTYDIAFPV